MTDYREADFDGGMLARLAEDHAPDDALEACHTFGKLALILLVLGCLLIAAPKIAASVQHYFALYAG